MPLTEDQILALNDWARTQPALRKDFDYTASQGVPGDAPPSDGLGDRLNSLASEGGVTTFQDLTDTPSDYGEVTTGGENFLVASPSTSDIDYSVGNLVLEELGRVTYSTASAVDFTDVFDDTSDYLLRIKGHWQGTALSKCFVVFTQNGGSSWDNSAVYNWHTQRQAAGTSSPIEFGALTDTKTQLFDINLSWGDQNGSARTHTGDMFIRAMGDSAKTTNFTIKTISTSSNAYIRTVGAYTTIAATNGIRIYTSSPAGMNGLAILYKVLA